MKKLALLTLLIVLSAAQTKWNFDGAHSNVGFSIDHMVISEVEGTFGTFTGTLESPSDDFKNAKITFEIDPASITTGNAKRDGHLKAKDFFNVEVFKTISFVSSSFTHVKGKKFKLVGEFTMHGVTKTVELDVKHNGTIKDPWGNTRAGFKVTGELNRADFGLTYGKVMEAGGLMVGHEVTLNINLEVTKAKKKK